MKHYQRQYEDLFRDKPLWISAAFESADGSIDELVELYQSCLNDGYRDAFRIAIRYLWLEKQLIINGKRRERRFRTGHSNDYLYGRFISSIVGRDQATLTRARWFQIVAASAAEMFPGFFLHNPFKEPEYYEWPYQHVGVDFLAYIYQVHNRFELLDYAEKMKMDFHTFRNWVNNYVLCYNDEQGGEIYRIGKTREAAPYIQRNNWDVHAQALSLSKLLKHESEKTSADNNDDEPVLEERSPEDAASSTT